MDLSRARNGFRIGKRHPVAVEGQTYFSITVLDRVEPDVRGDGIPAVYNCRCNRCGSIFVAKGSDVVHRRIRLCCQPRSGPNDMLQGRRDIVRDQDGTLVVDCPFCETMVTVSLGHAAGQEAKHCPCGATLRGGFAQKLVELKLTANERRALRLFRDQPRRAIGSVHGITRHALQRKGLLRGIKLTDLGRAALTSPDVPDIFNDLFPQKKET
jgi:hypothetical protein